MLKKLKRYQVLKEDIMTANRHVQWCSMSSKLQQDTITLPTRLSKIKRPVSPNAGKDGGAGYQNVYIWLAGTQNDAAGKVWLAGRLFMKLSIHLPHTKPAIPPLGIYPRNKAHIHKKTRA